MDMAQPVPDEPLPLSVGLTGSRPFPASARYSVVESGDGKAVTFTARQGLEVTKTLPVAHSGFELGIRRSTVRNTSAQARSPGELAVHIRRGVDRAPR